ncbi:MAG: hypothetical protein SFU83_04320 [Meiothermus sp.]|nr:hypothetical protein [Meiothermus sp.]
MADVQLLFEAFDMAIRMGTMDEDALLRGRRDRLLDDLRKGLTTVFREKNSTVPQFKHFNQGSYAMRTGVKPIGGEYDIDVGLIFDISVSAYPNPVAIKSWVLEALSRGAREVKMRHSCVTVAYKEAGRYTHHVDLAIYGQGRGGRLYLARGRENSGPRRRVWDHADPLGLIEQVQNYRSGLEREQFRRVIRYLKRWRDVSFPSEGNAAPVGIGLTVLALQGFRPVLNKKQNGQNSPDDLAALRSFIRWMLNSFEWVFYDRQFAHRLPANLPVTPRSNVLLRMSNNQMNAFESNLRLLLSVLEEAHLEAATRPASKKLRSVFGSDFPLPKGSVK